MEYIRGTEFEIPGFSAVTLGKFDGMHLGHQELLANMERFRADGAKMVVFTFGTSPYELSKGHTPLLMTNEERRNYCERAGVDYLIEFPFTSEVCHMSAETFIQKVICKQLHARYVVVGTDFGFGYKRQGNVALLKSLEERFGYQTFPIEKKRDETGRGISSTYIREELTAGHMEKAAALAGTPYYLSGEIVHGKQFGRTYGIPTINMIPQEGKLLPPFGVYVSRVTLEKKTYRGVTNIGVRPTVSETGNVNMKTFLFDFDGDVYGDEAVLELLHYIRPEKKFSSLEELETQIKADANTAVNWKER